MNAHVEPESYYDLLGLTKSASAEAIRHAYYSLVRTYPPQQFPENFQRLNAAYRTLADPQRRSEYDQNRENGRRVQALVDQAAIAAERDPQKAISLLKNAVALAPDTPRPHALLAHVLMRVEDHPGAERQYRWLLRYSPHEELLRFRLARCLWMQGRLDEAAAELEAALQINPGYYDALMLLSRLHANRHDAGAQVDALERAIANDGVENFADFEALLQLLEIHLQSGNAAEAERIEQRLLAVASPSRAVEAVQALYQRAQKRIESGMVPWANRMLQLAARISLPDDAAGLTQEIGGHLRRTDLMREAQALNIDSLVAGGLRASFYVIYLDRSEGALRQSHMDNALAELQRDLESSPRELTQRVDYIRCEYPRIAADQDAFLTQLRQRAVQRLAARVPVRGTAAPSAPSALPAPARPAEPARRGGLLGRLLGGR